MDESVTKMHLCTRQQLYSISGLVIYAMISAVRRLIHEVLFFVCKVITLGLLGTRNFLQSLRPRWGSLQRSIRPRIAGIKGTYFYGKGRIAGTGREGDEGGGRGS